MIERIIAAQIPFQPAANELAIDTEPRRVEISAGVETFYGDEFGLDSDVSVLLCVYVDGICAMELSVPIDEAERLSNMITDRCKFLKEHKSKSSD